MSVCVYECVRIFWHACLCMCVCAWMCVCECARTHAHAQTHLHKHARTHEYTQTCMNILLPFSFPAILYSNHIFVFSFLLKNYILYCIVLYNIQKKCVCTYVFVFMCMYVHACVRACVCACGSVSVRVWVCA